MISFGDYVFNGGEVVIMVMIEVIGCLILGVVGNLESFVEELYEDGLFEYFLYMKLLLWWECLVLDVFFSGNYVVIVVWCCE